MQPAQLKFRFAEDWETDEFSRQLEEQLGVTESGMESGWRWVIAEGPRTEVYLAPPAVVSSLQKLIKARMPYSAGLFIGGLQGRRLHVSLEAASHFAQILPAWKTVTLEPEAEQPVLYGRDVLAGSIRRIDRSARKGELVVLLNDLKEVLALGKMLVQATGLESIPPKERVIKNLIDKGWYLRKGG